MNLSVILARLEGFEPATIELGRPYGQFVVVTSLFYTVNPYCCAPVSHGVSLEWLTAWLTSIRGFE